MPRALLALALLALAAPAQAAETCPPIKRFATAPTYVILHGYRHAPDVPPARMVARDISTMTRFFRALGPRQLHAHAEDNGVMRHLLGDAFRPATWRALLESVEHVIRAIDADDTRPAVYIYLAGHGTVGERERLDLFTTPEPGATAPGYDGALDARLIDTHIIGPLAGRADVHLIVDTCHSYHIMQTRSAWSRDKLSPQPPLEMAYAHDFAAERPSVGALMAARGLTREEPNYGGVFSHMVRSLAIGGADLDRDGIVTYAEMAHALPRARPDIDAVPDPIVLAPGLDVDRPFIDWRATPAARVCFPGALDGKRLLVDRDGIFATVHLPGAPRAFWLPAGQTFGVDTWGAPARYFRAADGPLRYTASPRRTPAELDPKAPEAVAHSAPTADPSEAPETWEPFPGMLRDDVEPGAPPPPTPLGSRYSVGIGALVGSALTSAGRDGLSPAGRFDLAARFGIARHRALAEARYALQAPVHVDDVRDAPAAIYGHQLGGRAGYGYALTGGDVEWALDGLVGLYRLWNTSTFGPERFDIAEATVRAVGIRPLDDRSRWGLRFEGEIGVGYTGGAFGPVVEVAVGVDYETFLR